MSFEDVTLNPDEATNALTLILAMRRFRQTLDQTAMEVQHQGQWLMFQREDYAREVRESPCSDEASLESYVRRVVDIDLTTLYGVRVENAAFVVVDRVTNAG